MSDYSSFLFARPSFLEGMVRVLDMGGTLQEYNRALTPAQADALALYADAWAVGGDMRQAMEAFAREHALPYPPELASPHDD